MKNSSAIPSIFLRKFIKNYIWKLHCQFFQIFLQFLTFLEFCSNFLRNFFGIVFEKPFQNNFQIPWSILLGTPFEIPSWLIWKCFRQIHPFRRNCFRNFFGLTQRNAFGNFVANYKKICSEISSKISIFGNFCVKN